MWFSTFCDNSRKMNRTFIVLGVLIITGILVGVPLFKTLNPDQLAVVKSTKDVWFPIFAAIVGYFIRDEMNT